MKSKTNKILFILQLPPPVHGASVMNDYIKGSSIINNTFITSYLPLKFVSKIDEIGKFSLLKVIKMFLFCFKLIFRLVIFRPRLVYFTLAPHGGAFYRDSLFVFIIKLFRINIVFHMHGKGIEEEVKSSFKLKIYKKTFKNVTVITLSKLLDYDIKSIFFGKIYNLANGIPINTYKTIQKKNKVQLLFLSNLIKNKGVLDFVDALKFVDIKQFNYEVNIIGNSGDISIEELKKIIKNKKLEDIVNVLGPKYGIEKWNFLQKADMLVFPTKNDCFPLVLLEAMQAKTAIISTNNGAISEIIENCGIIVPENSPEKLAKVIQSLMVDKIEIEKLKNKAVEEFNKKYSLEMFEKNLEKILDTILKN